MPEVSAFVRGGLHDGACLRSISGWDVYEMGKLQLAFQPALKAAARAGHGYENAWTARTRSSIASFLISMPLWSYFKALHSAKRLGR
jgi:hypothetical protein